MQMKWWVPAEFRVILVGPVVDKEMGLVPLHPSKADCVTSATLCALVWKLKTAIDSTIKKY